MPSKTLAVTLPQMGESVTEGVVGTWRKQVGDHVQAGETLVEIQTDKIDAEVPAPEAGRLTRIVASEGEVVPVGGTLAEIELGGPAANGQAGSPPTPVAPPAKAVPVPLPALGESVTEGVVGSWRKRVGDEISAGETLVEIQTDKVDAEVPAPTTGTVLEILVPEGETVAVGTVLATIGPGAVKEAGGEPSSEPSAEAAGRAAVAKVGRSGLEVDATPLARRAAALQGIDVGQVAGTGPGGLVRRDDVGAERPGPTPTTLRPSQTVLIKGSSAVLVEAMEASLGIPTATSFRTIEVPVLETRRRQLNERLRAAGSADFKVSYTHLLGFALVRAADQMPAFSAGFLSVDGKPHKHVREGVNLGLAVDVERSDGTRFLLVPVIKAAHLLDFPHFHSAYEELVRKARTGGLSVDDLNDATITLTNPGGVGTVASVPRLMAGQAAIIAVGAIGYPPGLAGIASETAAAIGLRPVMTATSTYDHRLIQGIESGMLLQRLEGLLAGEDQFYQKIFASFALPLPPLPEASAPPSSAELAIVSGKPAPADGALLRAVAAGMSLVKAYRTHGHLAAHLDPLGSEPPGDPSLEPQTVGLNDQLMAQVPAEILRVAVPGGTLAEALPHLRQTYCGTIAYEIEHISSHEQRTWLRSQIESGAHLIPLSPREQMELLHRLAQVDAFERFLRKTYLGQHTFSIEGLDALVPMLEELIELFARDGAREIVLGMAHRGRLNVTARIVGRSLEDIIAEFESGAYLGGASTGDVKYHYGAEGRARTRDNREVGVVLTHNPSHLEIVDAVVEGRTRARQTTDGQPQFGLDTRAAVPVLIHGDAAFTGQGVVTETLNLQSLEGYRVGGTVHIIANNQIGFTTEPWEGRSTRYASDVAKGYDIPIVHVNADDVEACLAAVRLAVSYRATFERDVVIDLIGYRRFGHNEGDEPAYTQPTMMAKIRRHPTPVQVYGARLEAAGVVTAEKVEQDQATSYQEMVDAHARAMADGDRLGEAAQPAGTMSDDPRLPEVETAVGLEKLVALDRQLVRLPEGFRLNPKLARFFAQRPAAFREGGRVLWAQAEALALASLVEEGVAIRLTGQDTERGTFSQRHLLVHDIEDGAAYAPIQHLEEAQATFEVHNSPLSEMAAMGFEYGFAVTKPQALVIWEAQYGDFFNNAQVVVDQFIAAGQAKWDQESRLTLLLPHGYEGSGPEHSSARIERFLELAAEGNMRLAHPSTAAQYFHLLRLQALSLERRPLVVFTPKSGLRLPGATSTARELAEGAFRPVLDDPAEHPRKGVTRLLLASGKISHELMARRDADGRQEVGVVRMELLYPFPAAELEAVLASYPGLQQIVWVQEEPRNMGAYSYVAAHLRLPEGLQLAYIGRKAQASPSEGSMSAHVAEQTRLLGAAMGAVAPDPTPRAAS